MKRKNKTTKAKRPTPVQTMYESLMDTAREWGDKAREIRFRFGHSKEWEACVAKAKDFMEGAQTFRPARVVE